MARILLSMQKLPLFLPLPAVTLLVILMGVLSILSIVNFLCSSHGGERSYKRKKNAVVRLGNKKAAAGTSKLGSSLSSKALLMAKMISWRKVQDEGLGGDEEEEEAVWKKTIMMGERCRPLEFSGKILYDENGNPLPNTPPPSHNTRNI